MGEEKPTPTPESSGNLPISKEERDVEEDIPKPAGFGEPKPVEHLRGYTPEKGVEASQASIPAPAKTQPEPLSKITREPPDVISSGGGEPERFGSPLRSSPRKKGDKPYWAR